MTCEAIARQRVVLATVWHSDRTLKRVYGSTGAARAWVKARRETAPVVEWRVEEVWLYE